MSLVPAATNDLLIEIGCEDLPARYVEPLATALGRGFSEGLSKRGLDPADLRSFATPRRIAAIWTALPQRQPDQSIERKGPQLAAAFQDGAPTPAALGFARSCGVAFADLAQEDGHLVFRKQQPGKATLELLPAIFEETLKGMDELVPKRMRWGAGSETFVRPVQWLLALLGDEVVPLRRFGLEAGRLAYGHRFHAPAAIALPNPADYEAALRQAYVRADFAARRNEVRRQVEAQAAKLGGDARIGESLLDEVTALVEWPVAISGKIEERFLELPPEVIVATVETNQRYFTVFNAEGKLLPSFITVANIESKDVSQVVSGNERVVRPRLTDALFFWQQDLKQPLAGYESDLSKVTFQKELGSVAEKAMRAGRLAGKIAHDLCSQRDGVFMFKTSVLAKCDLATKMVYEFPELQGVMGGYYAAKSGEPEAVSRAIAEHYRPTQAGGPIPSTSEGQIVALADKLDTLAGIFKIGQKPTASKDPYALRRAALGVLRICIEGELALDLRAALAVAWDAQPVPERKDATLAEAWSFVIERLRGYCTDRGASTEQFEAVGAIGDASPLDFMRRLEALRAFQETPAAASLAAADKRARNILRQAKDFAGVGIDGQRFESPAEGALLAEIERVEDALRPAREMRAYPEMLEKLAGLKEPVDAFFDSVMVMAEDPVIRNNRLALLVRLDGLCREVADLSLLPG